MGSFLIMGLFGVILASLVNLFLQAPMLQFVISIVGVLVFAGLTAYDTQRLKSEYLYGAMDGETTERSAISGALSLYLNFINLFTLLMQLLGTREEMPQPHRQPSRSLRFRPGPASRMVRKLARRVRCRLVDQSSAISALNPPDLYQRVARFAPAIVLIRRSACSAACWVGS